MSFLRDVCRRRVHIIAPQELSVSHGSEARFLSSHSVSEDASPSPLVSWLSFACGGPQGFYLPDAVPWLQHLCILLFFQQIPLQKTKLPLAALHGADLCSEKAAFQSQPACNLWHGSRFCKILSLD